MLAHLILKDGETFPGRAPFGFGGGGEAVFTTAMAGYQEILTDPSFAGQMVCMTFPEQGIYGIHAGPERGGPALGHGPAVPPPHRRRTMRAEGDLAGWLKRHRIPVMTDLDTRALTLHLRDRGAQPAIIWTEADGGLEAGWPRRGPAGHVGPGPLRRGELPGPLRAQSRRSVPGGGAGRRHQAASSISW